MTTSLKALLALALAGSLSACVAGGNNRVDTTSEIEATTDQDIDGDGTVPSAGGVEVGVSG
ncbi:hypothetical protein JQC91_05595 [Jannaschia sp. Os4]|uniref:hypothetical protein n=1 Tax=Jannaschia sp. Os4 TaxID=2807617 RepID=UPI0019393DF4|nr:hypothetical protein [Jannaschia sp. Os4]MBM2575774.1 hypothetical protein [Jannaschia sp. Os4]